MKDDIFTKEAPMAVGPYSQAIQMDKFLFCSGQIPIDPKTGEVLKGSIQEQSHLVMKNVGAVLQAAGLTYDNIVKTTIFLSDMSYFQEMNAVYESYLAKPYPARSCVAVKELPKQVDVEVEVLAVR
tara:strand:+ start:558 stop:935 length:378 start_codon:yes stop_codon:yes gene_type:complete